MSESLSTYVRRLAKTIENNETIAYYAGRKFDVVLTAANVSRILSGENSEIYSTIKSSKSVSPWLKPTPHGGSKELLAAIATYHLKHSTLQPHERAYYQAVAQ